MFWYTHLAFAIGVASFLTVDPLLLGFAGLVGVLPDIDRIFAHRSWVSHSLLSSLVLGAAAFIASGFNLFFGLLVLIASLSHTLVDLFTKSGVPILYPISDANHGLRLFSAHNRAVNKAFIIVALLILLFNLMRGQGYV
jgi:membrane-bound metal-dependent hydrolase YbcI (DUF457 family)